MTQLFLVTEGDRRVWVAALLGKNLYSYVANTGRFHLNLALWDDFVLENEFDYAEIGVTEARRLIGEGVGRLDETKRADSLAGWRADPDPLTPDEVFASVAADL